ncbi:MAG TPA: hypothetical protein VJ001_13995 [Rhodocyclaceae bacterium]|nr:hypothetical protein [Rhodocyclaceae bacterium]
MTIAAQRRRLLQFFAASGLLGSAGVSGLMRAALAAGNNPVPPGIHKLKGEVTLNGKPATVGMLVRTGDTLRTAADAEAIYVVGQDAYLQRGNSTVGFAADAATQVLRVVSGKLLSVFGQGERRIQVSTATIGIRGTGCYIEDDPGATGPASARTYFCLCYGTAELVPGAAPAERETYSTTHHDKPMYIYNDMKMPKMMVPADVVNHSDLELTLLEGLVGRRPPFYGKGDYSY